MKQVKKSKFTLEKFEIAKLTTLNSIKGGTSNNLTDNTLTGTDTDISVSTQICIGTAAIKIK